MNKEQMIKNCINKIYNKRKLLSPFWRWVYNKELQFFTIYFSIKTSNLFSWIMFSIVRIILRPNPIKRIKLLKIIDRKFKTTFSLEKIKPKEILLLFYLLLKYRKKLGSKKEFLDNF